MTRTNFFCNLILQSRTAHSTPIRALNGIDEHEEDEEVVRPVERKIEARSERVTRELITMRC